MTVKNSQQLAERAGRVQEAARKIAQLAVEMQGDLGGSVTGYVFGQNYQRALQNGGMAHMQADSMTSDLVHSFSRLAEMSTNIFEQANDMVRELGTTEHIIEAGKSRTGPKPHPQIFATDFEI